MLVKPYNCAADHSATMFSTYSQRSALHSLPQRHAAVGPQQQRPRRSKVPVIVAEGNGDGSNRPRSSKGKSYDNSKRRKGRPAHTRSPYDSPLRDGNRDRLVGLLTERAAKTLLCYLMETNLNVYHWLLAFLKENPIPRNGNWDDVSGETFLRTLLSMPVEVAKFETGRDPMFDNVVACGVDPRSIAQRIMEIRSQLSKEFIQDLTAVDEENSILLRETLQNSLMSSMDMTGAPVQGPNSASSTPSKSHRTPTKDRLDPTPAAPPAAPIPVETPAPTVAETPNPTVAETPVPSFTAQLPPEVAALLKSAYPDGQAPQSLEDLHPEIRELLQLPAAPAPAANTAAAAPVEGAQQVAPAAEKQEEAAQGGSDDAAANDLVGTLEGNQSSDAGSPDDLVITNVAGQKVVLGSGEGAEKVVALSAEASTQQPEANGGNAAGEAAAGEAESS